MQYGEEKEQSIFVIRTVLLCHGHRILPGHFSVCPDDEYLQIMKIRGEDFSPTIEHFSHKPDAYRDRHNQNKQDYCNG